ncbi:MAG: hypothetical protein Q9N68_10485 [Gammaproteobacteria bacterium]|nr:hypothetical protein [Gammaproteobacteria bacterium]
MHKPRIQTASEIAPLELVIQKRQQEQARYERPYVQPECDWADAYEHERQAPKPQSIDYWDELY